MRPYTRVAVVATVAGVCGCAVAVVGYAITGGGLAEVLFGGLLAIVFFGISSLAVAIAARHNDTSLLSAILSIYVVKVTALASAALLIPVPATFDRRAFAVGVVAAAVAYVAAEVITLARDLARQ